VLIFRSSLSPAIDTLDESVAAIVRQLWANLLSVGREFVIIVESSSSGGLVSYNFTDAPNVVGNRAGLNSTEAILAALAAPVGRRQLAGRASVRHSGARALGSLELAAPAPVAAREGSTDLSFNILARSPADAAALSRALLVLTPAAVAAGVAAAVAAAAAAATTAARRAAADAPSAHLNLTVTIDTSSVVVSSITYRYVVYGVVLDFLQANIRTVLGGAAGIIVLVVMLSLWHRCCAMLKASAKARRKHKVLADVATARRELRLRLLRTRVRGALRGLVQAQRLSRSATARAAKTAAREAAIEARAAAVQASVDDSTVDSFDVEPPPPPPLPPPPPTTTTTMLFSPPLPDSAALRSSNPLAAFARLAAAADVRGSGAGATSGGATDVATDAASVSADSDVGADDGGADSDDNGTDSRAAGDSPGVEDASDSGAAGDSAGDDGAVDGGAGSVCAGDDGAGGDSVGGDALALTDSPPDSVTVLVAGTSVDASAAGALAFPRPPSPSLLAEARSPLELAFAVIRAQLANPHTLSPRT
jgi:hypothetical protein